MAPFRCDFRKRNQNECALLQARMWENRRPRLHDAVIIQDIEIERTWRIARTPHPADAGLTDLGPVSPAS